jgi:hypothetical protein
MEFGVFEHGEQVMSIAAESEKEAWNKIHKAGIRNKSKIFHLIRLD